jgi:hypothetical protein
MAKKDNQETAQKQKTKWAVKGLTNSSEMTKEARLGMVEVENCVNILFNGILPPQFGHEGLSLNAKGIEILNKHWEKKHHLIRTVSLIQDLLVSLEQSLGQHLASFPEYIDQLYKCDPIAIDWTKSIAEIDQQLYKKYGLSQKEIDFIETHVKPMDDEPKETKRERNNNPS